MKNNLELMLILVFLSGCFNKTVVSKTETDHYRLRVLGYLPGAGNWKNNIDSIDLNKITDLNLAFINPDSSGNFPSNEAYQKVVQKAHSHKVRVFISIGGGGPPAYLEKLLEKNKRTALIEELVNLTKIYEFDGVDVDLENALINHNYAPFVSELSSALKQRKKLMTAALASWNANTIHDSTMQLYDFINIMSYDKTGPWNRSNPGPHSPYQMAENDFIYFNNTRGIAAEKLFIGLPFYGYGFGNGAPVSMSYKNIIINYPGAEHADSINPDSGGTLYYNGIATIRQKVLFAKKNKAGGVMIWQLLGDSKDSKSLLTAINEIKDKD
ncbi:MAG: glycosyl hydrolase family 18 protein [Chitinophagaceae bacterium]